MNIWKNVKIHIWNPNKTVIGKYTSKKILYSFCGLCEVDIGTIGHTYKPSFRDKRVYCKTCLKLYKEVTQDGNDYGIPPKPKVLGILPTII